MKYKINTDGTATEHPHEASDPGFAIMTQEQGVDPVHELLTRVAAAVDRAARLSPRPGSKERYEAVKAVLDNHRDEISNATGPDSDAYSNVLAKLRGGHRSADSVISYPEPDTSSLSEGEIEQRHVAARRYLERASEMIAVLAGHISTVNRRFIDAIEAGASTDDGDPGEIQALERALGVLLVFGEQAVDTLNDVVAGCEEIDSVIECGFRLDRLMTEMELYSHTLPQAVVQTKFHLDKLMADVGRMVFREGAYS
jgi:hypothetical protein